MSTTSNSILHLARQLIALETADACPSAAGGASAVRACEKLRSPLSKLIGAVGFCFIMSRAATTAKAEHPSLDGVHVRPDGALGGTDGEADGIHDAEAGVVLVAHLLGLLVTLIGELVTIELVRDVWQEATLTRKIGEKNKEEI